MYISFHSATCFGLFLGHHQASAYNYTTVHIFSIIFYVYMLIVYTFYTLYCLYSTHELFYHRAQWLGVPCTCAYGPSFLLGSVYRWHSVVNISCFRCGCGSSYLLGAVRPVCMYTNISVMG
jgi:hypothetical protein